MLKESGNLIEAGISITKELLDFAKANNYKISLKTGAYQKEPILTTRGQKYNLDLLSAVHHLYYAGNLYLADFIEMFGISKLDDLAQIFKKSGLKMLTRKEVQELYGDQIKQRAANTIDRKIEEGTRKPRKTKVPKIPKEPKAPKIKVTKTVREPKQPKANKIYPTKIENQMRSVSVTENGQPVKNFLYNGEYLLKALKIVYRGNRELLDQILATGTVDIQFITPEVDKAFDFAVFAENLVPILLEEHQISYESLTVGEFTFDHYIPERNLVIEVTNIPEFTDNLVDNQYFKRMNKSLTENAEKKIKLLRFGIDDVWCIYHPHTCRWLET